MISPLHPLGLPDSQHTPGPWRAERPVSRWRIRNAAGHYIFEELGRGAEVRREADARLIAAAPDLYWALKAFTAELPESWGDIVKQTGRIMLSIEQETIDAILAALKSVEGQ